MTISRAQVQTILASLGTKEVVTSDLETALERAGLTVEKDYTTITLSQWQAQYGEEAAKQGWTLLNRRGSFAIEGLPQPSSTKADRQALRIVFAQAVAGSKAAAIALYLEGTEVGSDKESLYRIPHFDAPAVPLAQPVPEELYYVYYEGGTGHRVRSPGFATYAMALEWMVQNDRAGSGRGTGLFGSTTQHIYVTQADGSLKSIDRDDPAYRALLERKS